MIYTVKTKDNFGLSLDKTLNCGQAFRWVKIRTKDNSVAYSGFIKNQLVIVREVPGGIEAVTENLKVEDIQGYFNINLNYDDIIDSIGLDNDRFTKKSIELSEGLRVVKQDFWETLVTFLISQRNTVERIARTVENISSTFGQEVSLSLSDVDWMDGLCYKRYKFPTAEEIYTNIDKLKDMGLGYRDKFIVRLVKDVHNGVLKLDAFDESKPTRVLDELIQGIYGVGPKVSSCIVLFAFNRYEAFPIDTWINKVLDNVYGGYTDISRFKGYAGIIQQFWYYAAKYKALNLR